jgi:hypothetical protein
MIEYIKSYFPSFYRVLVKLNEFFQSKYVISNYFHVNYEKRALLSYIIYPFKKQSLSHTNYYEAITYAKVLDEMGYAVDIVHYTYDKHIDFSKYDLLVGFGEPFTTYFKSGFTNTKTIYYGTGMHQCRQNNATLKRLKQVYIKKRKWLTDSIRYVDKTWNYQTMLVDGIIVLGNDVCMESYSKFYNGPIYGIPAPFYKTFNGYQILSERSKYRTKTNFLWFGGKGLIHKGLDLVLEFFSDNPQFKLHVCGPIKNEPKFEKEYFKELYQTENIITHDFINISSDAFRDILLDCSFVIFPSCSEGGSPSIITAIGNGALIPIITRETTISTGNEIWIENFDINEAINKTKELNDEQIMLLQKENIDYILKYHSQETYYENLKTAIIKILDGKYEL